MTTDALAVLEPFPPSVVSALRVIPPAGLSLLDPCVLRYLARALEGQMTAESRVDDDAIVAALAAHLAGFGVAADVAGGRRMAGGVVAAFNAACPPPAETAADALAAPVTIGKAYDDSLRQAAKTRAPRKAVVHANEQWTWAESKAANKEHIRMQKEEERRQALLVAYDEFLKKRGISAQRTVMKLHVNEGVYVTDVLCQNVHIAMGKKLLLENAELVLHSGHRYGLVGRNGCGKTTLLRALSEKEIEGVSPFIQIVHVEQEIAGSSETPLEVVLAADVERAKLIEAERNLLRDGVEDADQKLAEVYARMDAIDAHSAEARGSAILSGLSFTKDLLALPTSRLSGGWRMRVALARALFAEPDILLLDEPTNHLDLHAVLWLEAFLRDWRRTLVVVSHSRSFLNNVCAEMIHLHDGQLTYYNGNYDQFELSRCEALKLQMRQHEAQEKQRAHMQAFVDKFRYSAARAAMAQSRLKALERMERVAPVMADAAVSFDFPEAETLSGPIVQVLDGAFGYKADNLFTNVNVTIDSESRTVLVGANGAGKSTFLSLCLGHLEPRQGQVLRNPRARIGHFTQHHLDMLTPQMTALEFLSGKYPNTPAQQLRATMGSFGLSGEIAMQPIYTLSGGQKSRLALAWVCMQNPHLLVLDEPTNHLDIDTVSALLQALMEFKGGVLVVSHDEHLITTLCDELLVCAGGTIAKFEGDFDAYKASISHRR